MAKAQASYRGYRRDVYRAAGLLPAWRRDGYTTVYGARSSVVIHASLEEFNKRARAGKPRRR